VWQPPADPLEPVEQIPRLEHRRVERLAVETDERAGRFERRGRARQQRPLVGGPCQQELPDRQAAVFVERRAPHQECLRSSAAAEARGLEVEKEKGRSRRLRAEQRRIAARSGQLLRHEVDPHLPVARGRLEPSLDDEAPVSPRAVQNGFEGRRGGG
jgi:hypothetical protein